MSENIEKMIDALVNDDMVGAGDAFKDALNDKISTTLDQERISVANEIFNDEFEVSEEEIEQELETEE